jgi:solute carrier family 25 S-adenosylmethionine transporter 26
VAIPKVSILSWLPDWLKNGIASGSAAVVVKTILQPFDTIKTVQQARNAVKLTNPLRAGLEVIKTRGIAGLWSGIGITVIGSSPSVAVYFGVYSSCKRRLTKMFPPNMHILAIALSATIGNTLASFLRVPYEVIKQRIQNNQHSSTWEALQYSFKTEGAFGLFSKGKLASQILRDVPYAIVTLVSYEILQKVFQNIEIQKQIKYEKEKNSKNKDTKVVVEQGNRKLKDAFCGALAGGLGSFATTPMDVVKTRMMTGLEYNSIMDATVRIFKEEGIMTFFVGTTPRLMHKIPANGLFFLCYEMFRQMLGVKMQN